MRALRLLVVTALAVGSFVAAAVASGDVAGAQSPGVMEYGGLSEGSVPMAMTAGPDGRTWYADPTGKVGAVTTDGEVTEYPVRPLVLDIASGPSGALWVAGDGDPIISRVTTGGAVTDFTMPDTGAAAGAGIAVGPDGNLWYTRAGVVGKMTPAGEFTEYTVPLPDPLPPGFFSNPTAITTGPDGTMYFVERFDNGRIGQVTTGGVFTMYAGVGGDLRDIVRGPDNNIWVVNAGSTGSDVGRLSAGSVSWFDLPGRDLPGTELDLASQALALTSGPDGNLWVAGTPSLWRVSTSGSSTPFALGLYEFAATGITAGPDGRIWYSLPNDPSDNGAQIGALSLGNHPYGEFTSLTPSRLLDTRDGTGGVNRPLGPGGSLNVQITGRGGVPSSGVSAVVLNATAVNTTAGSFLSVWPTGSPRPLVSNLNYGPGQIVANMVTVAVGEDGRLSAFNGAGSTDVIFDVVGYYSDASGPFGARFKPVNPSRLFDTRDGVGGVPRVPVGPNSSMSFDVTGSGGVPFSGVTGVVMNVTVADSTNGGYVTVYPGDVTRPNASSLNFPAGRSVPNLVTVRVPSNGIVSFYNAVGQTHLLADVVGYYTTDETTNEGRFVPLPPQRSLDTRVDLPGPVEEGVVAPMGGFGGAPHADIGALALNVTVTDVSAGGFLSVFPDDLCQLPYASNLNFVPGQTVPNQVITRLSPEWQASSCQVFPTGLVFFNAAGTVHVIADVFGYFTNGRFAVHDDPPPPSALGEAFDQAQDILAGAPEFPERAKPWEPQS